MATESNNIQVNSFGKGMNSDTSLDMILDGQYIFGENIRITSNALLGHITDSNSTEGIISPINCGYDVTPDSMYNGEYKILATASIDNIGAVIISDGDRWYVYRLDFDEDEIKFSLLFESEIQESIADKFSVVINRELKSDTPDIADVVKLYIADGVHQLMLINLMDNVYNKKITGNTDNITSNHLYPSLQVKIEKQISGSLKTSQVQYTYRLYKKYGISSKLAPLTNKIQIIDGNRNKEEGNAEDTVTSIGLLLSIPINDLSINNNIFDHVLVFRLSYIKAQEDATVDLIYDSFIKDSNLVIRDSGNNSLKELSIDEFSAINSMILIPKNIEQSQNYMFISNVKDETVLRVDDKHINIDSKAYQRRCYNDGGIQEGFVLRNNNNPYSRSRFIHVFDINDITDGYDVNPYSVMNPSAGDNTYEDWQACKYKKEGSNYYWGGEGKNVNWKFVTTSIVVHDNFDIYSPNCPYSTGNQRDRQIYYINNNNLLVPTNVTTDKYLQDHSISAMKSLEYDDIIGSSMFRSLRRDEVYRYGIVYYDKYGKRSDVQWIGDIKTPTSKDCSNFSTSYENRSGLDPVDYTLTLEVDGDYKRHKYTKHYGGHDPYTEEYYGYEPKNFTVLTFDFILQKQVSVHLLSTVYPKEKHDLIKYHIYADDVEVLFPYTATKTQQIRIETQFLQTPNFLSELTAEKYIVDQSTSVKYVIRISNTVENSIDNILLSNPLGIKFDISVPKESGITSYQIVRCSKQSEYSKTLMQCALSRPMRLKYSASNTTSSLKSPYYPTPFLTSQAFWTHNYVDGGTDISNNLFSIHSSEISTYPEDSLSLISKNDSTIKPILFNYQDRLYAITYALSGYQTQSYNVFEPSKWGIVFNRHNTRGASGEEAIDFKSGSTCNLYMYRSTDNMKNADGAILYQTPATIEEVSEVQNPTWEQGFTNIQLSGSKIIAGVKAYKSYVSTVKTDQYVNWVCNGMYNLRISGNESQSGIDDGKPEGRARKVFTYLDQDNGESESRSAVASGWVGPGPLCMLIRLSNPGGIFLNSITNEQLKWELTIGTLICNVQHTAQQFAGFNNQEKQFDIYYGFGNYGLLKDDGNGNMIGSIIVFDGDVYNLPCELVSMYKTYNFNSIKDTIPSAQIVNYVPLETKMNTFFDYGMNYRNTQSPNLLIEPGEITGVCSQDRPQHQYNPIYSDNNVSNDVYNALSEESNTQTFTQRIFYSQLKTNGEYVDNWSDFRALDYIDADTRYGDITHMLTNKDVLYFWQLQAFGKLSVNERSLITDNNNNTIQLGQGGVLQRTDYISTTYGLRYDDRSAISTLDGIFWIDIINKAVLLSQNGQVVNYGERLNVQNIINSNISTERPSISFDIQNQELLCKFLNDDKQLVFNTKLGCATSVYTRDYEDTIMYNNIVYGLTSNCKVIQYNYLKDNTTNLPSILEFVVNQQPSVTKVFDNQLINTLKREYDSNYAENFMSTKTFTFTTNLNESSYDNQRSVVTDREGNICYTIPRIGNEEYGNRLRGRWMKVRMEDNNPEYDYSISHVLTKFRQSFN